MARFDWDSRKDAENQRKHGVSFAKVQYAFADPHRIIARDITHSTAREQRFFCFGNLGDGIVTVRFTYRKDVIRIFGAATGERVSESMSAKRKYSEGPIDEVEVVEDFLPSPDELAFKEDTVKVTIALSKSSVDFFKAKAEKHHTAYQKMIRRLLDSYVDRYSGT